MFDFSVTERLAWAETRETTRKEDKAYSLLGIFDIHMPLIYGEGREKAFKRLREETDKALKGRSFSFITSSYRVKMYISTKKLTRIGIKHKDFSVTFSLATISGIEHFTGRGKEIAEIYKNLSGDGSRHTVILHGLGGIGKTQLSIAYAKRYNDYYSAIFWLNIKDEDSLEQSFAKTARQTLQERPSVSRISNVNTNKNLDDVVDAVKAWLSLANKHAMAIDIRQL